MVRIAAVLVMSVAIVACAPERSAEVASVPEASASLAVEESEPGHTHGADDPIATVPRVNVNDLRAGVVEGWAVVVDVRSRQQYEASHIAGAVSVPIGELEARIGELPRDRMIVTYCT